MSDRRTFLRRLAGLPLVGTLAVPAAAQPTHAAENPIFATLAKDLNAAERAWRAAHAAKQAAQVRFDEMCPVPEDLIKGTSRYIDGTRPDLDTCGGLQRVDPATGDLLFLLDRGTLQREVSRHTPRSKAGREARRRVKLMARYQEAAEKAATSSGLQEAMFTRRDARNRIVDLARTLSATDALTLAGIALKARALLLCNEASGSKEYFEAGAWFGRDLMHNIVAIGGTNA